MPHHLVVLLSLASPAGATDYSDGDYGGADLVLGSDDTVQGTLENVGLFEVPAGAYVVVDGAAVVHAVEVHIDGTLTARGEGHAGGDTTGSDGQGAGGGEGGDFGNDVGGAGGGYGGGGGDSDPGMYGVALGGEPYGDPLLTTLERGSGGGGCVHTQLEGGAGGGAIGLYADLIHVGTTGIVDVSGSAGDDGDEYWDCGPGAGGGSGGSLLLDAGELAIDGALHAKGARGTDATDGWCYLGAPRIGGGGGGGGRIALFGTLTGVPVVEIGGGPGGSGLYVYESGDDGQAGTYTVTIVDLDGDLYGDELDNCPELYNALQEDFDEDGVGNLCDPCPFAAGEIDADGDLTCDDLDLCPGFDDGDDDDADGIPTGCDLCPVTPDPAQGDFDADFVGDACDPCPIDAPDDSDADGVCDTADLCLGDDGTEDEDADGFCGDLDACIGDDDTGDVDADGYCAVDAIGRVMDCDDADAETYPGAPELCDGVANACAGLPANEADLDGDGVPICDADCDDLDAGRNASIPEVCDNGVDDDCDGVVDEDCSGGCSTVPTSGGPRVFPLLVLLLAGMVRGALRVRLG